MGRRTVYGVMPDWNPAEIIGIRPKPLSLSLYRIVTDPYGRINATTMVTVTLGVFR